MALGTPIQVMASGVRSLQRSPRAGFSVDLRRPAEIWFFTKLTGDTGPVTITAAALKNIREVILINAATGAAITPTSVTGYGSNAVVIDGLGANAVGCFAVLIGNKNTR